MKSEFDKLWFCLGGDFLQSSVQLQTAGFLRGDGGRQGRHCAPAQAPGVKVSQCKHGIPQEPRSHGHLRGRRAAGDGRRGSVAEGDRPSLAEDETAGFTGQ